MNEGIKRMLAERAGDDRLPVTDSPKKMDEVEAVMEQIDLAAPFIDERSIDQKKWKPSTLLRIGYLTFATGDTPKLALPFVHRHLAIARQRYRAGQNPNPFVLPDEV